jgi:uncharacterized protein
MIIIDNFIALSLDIAPLLLFGISFAAMLHVFIPERQVLKHLGSNSNSSIVKSTLFAIPLPLCSCSVIPVVASLRKKGASKGASVSFLIAAPQVGIDSFLITYGMLGWFFSIYRIIASLFTALFAGVFENIFNKSEITDRISATPISIREETFKDRIGQLPAYVMELLGSFSNNLLFGLVLAATIMAVIPDGFFENHFGSNQWLSMIVMLIVGIPLYVCATASTPIAVALILKGISPGAALVFLLTGPATNVVTLAMLNKSLGRRPLLIYLASIAIVALVMGYLLNQLPIDMEMITSSFDSSHGAVPLWKYVGTAILAAMLILHYISKVFKKDALEPDNSLEIGKVTMNELKVNGMTCEHCSGRVERAILELNLTSEIHIDISKDSVKYRLKDDTPGDASKQVEIAIVDAGYDLA